MFTYDLTGVKFRCKLLLISISGINSLKEDMI